MKLFLSKKDVSERLLKTAILLLFTKGDSVSSHLLACSAHQILHDVSGYKKSMLKGKNIKNYLVNEEARLKWDSAMHEARNFFKHAKDDSDKILRFDTELSHFIICDAIVIYESLYNKKFPEAIAFCIWFSKKYPDVLSEDNPWTAVAMKLYDINMDICDDTLLMKIIAVLRKEA